MGLHLLLINVVFAVDFIGNINQAVHVGGFGSSSKI